MNEMQMQMQMQTRHLPSTGVPLQDLRRDNGHRQLAVRSPAVASSRFSRFNLPDGWFIEEVPRRRGYRVDRYYYEAGSGIKFRSLPEVQRYINGESRAQVLCRHVEKQRHGYTKHAVYGGKVIKPYGEDQKQLARVESTVDSGTSTTNLPDGWIIEEVPRRFGGSDKYYYEPGTGQQFRSRIAVLRHLQGLEEDMPLSSYVEAVKENTTPSKAFKLHRKGKKRASRNSQATSVVSPPKKIKWIFGRNSQATSVVSPPPKKIKWILGSTGGDVWHPFNFEVPVAESVKRQWNQRFMAVMKDGDNAAPKSGKSMHF